MVFRTILIAIGALCLLLGLFILVTWVRTPRAVPEAAKVVTSQKVAFAAVAVQAGDALTKADIEWKEMDSSQVGSDSLLQGQEAELLGSTSQRNFERGDRLIRSEFLSSRSLANIIRPGALAVSIPVDAPQSVTGMVQRDDRVDVILTQMFDEKIAPEVGRRHVSETVLRNVRVLAIDQTTKPEPLPEALKAATLESRVPRTVTLELTSPDEVEKLMVAAKLGTFQLALLSRTADGAGARTETKTAPVWASEASHALRELARPLREVSVRVYTGTPRSGGYLCTKAHCVPSESSTVAAEGEPQDSRSADRQGQPNIQVISPR